MAVKAQEPRLADLIARHYGQVQPNILRYLLQWIMLMRDAFDGDLDAMIVMAVISDRALRDPRVRSVSYPQILEAPQIEPDIPLTNRKSIADSTGIPRETVRRKVTSLLAHGWIAELEDGTLVPNRTGSEALHQTTLRSIEILGHLGEALVAARRL